MRADVALATFLRSATFEWGPRVDVTRRHAPSAQLSSPPVDVTKESSFSLRRRDATNTPMWRTSPQRERRLVLVTGGRALRCRFTPPLSAALSLAAHGNGRALLDVVPFAEWLLGPSISVRHALLASDSARRVNCYIWLKWNLSWTELHCTELGCDAMNGRDCMQ